MNDGSTPLVVGVDGSPDSLRAVRWAVTTAERLRLPVRLMRALGSGRRDGHEMGSLDALIGTVPDLRGHELGVRMSTTTPFPHSSRRAAERLPS